eukprot:SAG31_NODE_1682_length_7537_cov_4.810164_10_plen_80_part_00
MNAHSALSNVHEGGPFCEGTPKLLDEVEKNASDLAASVDKMLLLLSDKMKDVRENRIAYFNYKLQFIDRRLLLAWHTLC